MKNKTNIAMRCNQEQWELLKPKLENDGYSDFEIDGFEKFKYLTNNLRGCVGLIANIKKQDAKDYNRQVHKEFNEKVFLEACGISEEPKFEITKETVIKYQMKDEFPEAFENVFKTGYYKHKNGEHPKWFSYANFETQEYYGCGTLGDWFFGKSENHLEYIVSCCELMNAEEVTEALKNEAVKRGFKEGVFCDHKNPSCDQKESIKDFFYHEKDNALYGNKRGCGGAIIFKNGIWATVIPTKTIQEAEELLNCKII